MELRRWVSCIVNTSYGYNKHLLIKAASHSSGLKGMETISKPVKLFGPQDELVKSVPSIGVQRACKLSQPLIGRNTFCLAWPILLTESI